MHELSYQQAKDIASQYGSPFYLFDANQFESNINKMRSAFEQYYDAVLLGYSYKTNYLPHACQIVRSFGGYAEVVSRLEYELALRIGHAPDEIIFNGPLKKRDDLYQALSSSSIVHLDGFHEIQIIHSLLSEKLIDADNLRIGLRININLEGKDGISYTQDGLQEGRFGFPVSDLKKAIDSLRNMGIEPISLHGHSSSSNRSVENFVRISETLCNVRDHFSLDRLKFFDVGGGFFGDVPKAIIGKIVPTFNDYAKAISTVMLSNKWIKENKPILILEPGVAVSANSLSFYTRIFNQKNVANKHFLTVDGSIYNTKPTMHSCNLPYRHLSKDKIDKPSVTYDVVGSTCMEKDILLKAIKLIKPKVGDYIEVKNVGAYTIVMTPPFINLAPAIITIDSNKKISLAREKQTTSHFLEPYHFNL